MKSLSPEFNLKPYQEEAVEYCMRNKYSIVALDPGLGKTLVALEVIFRLKLRPLIIVPSFLVPNWVSEINKFYKNKIVTVFKDSKSVYIPFDSDVVITTFDIVARNEDTYASIFAWANIVVVDEATAYKNMEAKRSESFHRLLYEQSVPRCLLLTGTPIQNRVYELYSLIAICNYNPKIDRSEFLERFPTWIDFADYFSYREERYITTKKGRKLVPTWERFRNVKELKHKYLSNIYIRFKQEDVLTDLPEYVSMRILIEDIKLDDDYFNAFTDYINGKTSVEPKIKKEVALKKVPFTVKYVKENLDIFDNVVIYSDHPDAAEAIANEFGVPFITGETPVDERVSTLKKFYEGKIKQLVATIRSFNVGVNIVNCNFMVFNDINWNPGENEQARRRIRRIGQTKICNYHYIFGTIQDEKIFNKIEEKELTIREVT